MDIHTKFSIGDRVVALHGHRLKTFVVESVSINATAPDKDRLHIREDYGLADDKGRFVTIDGSFVFSSRQELIDSI